MQLSLNLKKHFLTFINLVRGVDILILSLIYKTQSIRVFQLKFSFPMLNAALYNKRLQLFVANFVVANLLQILVEGEIYV